MIMVTTNDNNTRLSKGSISWCIAFFPKFSKSQGNCARVQRPKPELHQNSQSQNDNPLNRILFTHGARIYGCVQL